MINELADLKNRLIETLEKLNDKGLTANGLEKAIGEAAELNKAVIRCVNCAEERLKTINRPFNGDYKRKHNDLAAFLRQETIPYLERITAHAKENEDKLVYQSRHTSVNDVSRELKEAVKGLLGYLGGSNERVEA